MNDHEAPEPEQIDRQYTAALVVTESGEVLGALSIGETADSTHLVPFGAQVREDDGTPIETVWRELQDALGIEIDPGDIVPLRSEMAQRPQDDQWEMYHYFYVTVPDDALERSSLREGQDWTRITGADDPLVPTMLQPIIADIYEKLALGIFE
jgi:hypothetical protein